MHTWSVVEVSSGTYAELAEVSLWAFAVSEAFELIDVATGHVLCGERMPDWVWRVPLGKPRYDGVFTDTPANSLGSLVYDIFNWGFGTRSRHERILCRIPVESDAL